MTKNTKTVIILLVIAALIAIVPLFALKGAEFGGSDDAGSEMISEIQGKEYEPWFTPVLETALGGELPGEIESLLHESWPYGYTREGPRGRPVECPNTI